MAGVHQQPEQSNYLAEGQTFKLKQTYKSFLFLSETMDIFVWLAVTSKPSSQPIWLKA